MKILLTVSFLFFANAVWSQAQSDIKIKELSDRIESLERNQQDLLIQTSEENSKVNSFLRSNLALGGFFEPSFTLLQGPDTQFKAASSSNILGLNFAAEYSNRLRFVGQVLTGLSFPLQNAHNDPRDTRTSQRAFGPPSFGALLTQGYLDYDIGNGWNLSGGQGYAPFGNAAQQRELVLFIRRGGPQLLRTTELFSQLWSGFHLHKTIDFGEMRTGFNAYTFTRLENANTPGVGARAWLETPGGKIQTGLSYQTAKYSFNMDHIIGYDLRVQTEDILVTAEYAVRFCTERNPWSVYLEPSLFIFREEVLLYTFVDYANSPVNKTNNTISDPYQKFEYGTGLNWLPTSYTRLRLGTTYHNYIHDSSLIQGKNRDYISVDISAGVAF